MSRYFTAEENLSTFNRPRPVPLRLVYIWEYLVEMPLHSDLLLGGGPFAFSTDFKGIQTIQGIYSYFYKSLNREKCLGARVIKFDLHRVLVSTIGERKKHTKLLVRKNQKFAKERVFKKNGKLSTKLIIFSLRNFYPHLVTPPPCPYPLLGK